ncbi:telomeric repeat binding factor a isoform X2 [Stegastes partitus]|uniref:Telomeric repeat binding factor a isoform X2 n=1 Tax=Stegastes partitus TaxID=144197 RepID=A0A9Y4MYJ9_9TELE|nr:PREDICTED: telomeric repeat-binding factor 2 isoform X2 [Stegastes partitus]
MAAKDAVNNDKSDVESIVNRWLVDYYVFRAMDMFKKEDYEGFCGVRDVLKSVLERPVELTDVMPTKIRVLELLSRINEGEKLDLSFESDPSVTPLESALVLLKKMNQECSIPPQDFDNVKASITEMIVGIFIKNNKFDKAQEMLNKHFPRKVSGKKAIFMDLIRQKRKIHEVIEQMNFQRFREEMLAFCQKLCQFTVPFLHKAAEQLIDERTVDQDDKAAGTDEQAKPGPSSHVQGNAVQFAQRKYSVIQRARLEVAFKALAAASENTFAQLEEEVEREAREREDLGLLRPDPKRGTNLDSEPEGLFQRDSGSPLEASPADLPPQTDAASHTQACSISKTPSGLWSGQLYTVPRLVVEPDSQVSSQCTTASLEQGPDVRTEKPPKTLTRANKKDLQCPITDREVDMPMRKCPRRSNRKYRRVSANTSELSIDSTEDSSDSVADMESDGRELHNQSNSSSKRKCKRPKRLSSDSEEHLLQLSASSDSSGDSPSKDPGNVEDICTTDSSLESSPSRHTGPQTSSTPHKDSAQSSRPSHSKWKQLFANAKESKDTWTDEDSYFTSAKNSGRSNESVVSHSGQRRTWTEKETQNLKDGVKTFGEGNWKQIRSYYSFNDRTNVNLKDRWRTLKRLNMV